MTLLVLLAGLGCRTDRVEPRAEVAPSVPPRPAALEQSGRIDLPAPVLRGGMSLEQALASRRSVREFSATALKMAELGQLAWAAQGVTQPDGGLRAAPSAGALYPLELYFVLRDGLLHYLPGPHAFERISPRDLREPLADAALSEGAILSAPCTVVITSATERTAARYGARATLYVSLEAGHAAQNLLLQATALGLAGVPIGAFDDRAVSGALSLPAAEQPIYIVALGAPRVRAAGNKQQ